MYVLVRQNLLGRFPLDPFSVPCAEVKFVVRSSTGRSSAWFPVCHSPTVCFCLPSEMKHVEKTS